MSRLILIIKENLKKTNQEQKQRLQRPQETKEASCASVRMRLVRMS
jgi:hypothetical protein